MKLVEREKAIELRKKGLTYPEIMKQINVSKGCLSNWLQDVEYTPTEESLKRRRLASIKNGRANHEKKLKRIAKIKEKAFKEIQNIDKETLKIAGLMIHWAEGSKSKDHQVELTNSSPEIILLFIKWLKEICKVKNERLRVHVRVHSDVNPTEAEEYWSNLTGIPLNQFIKTTIKISGSNGKRHNKLPNGIVSVTVCDTQLFYKIRGWIEGFIDKCKISINNSDI